MTVVVESKSGVSQVYVAMYRKLGQEQFAFLSDRQEFNLCFISEMKIYLKEVTPRWCHILTVSFIGGGIRSTRRKPPTCRKSLTNFKKCDANRFPRVEIWIQKQQKYIQNKKNKIKFALTTLTRPETMCGVTHQPTSPIKWFEGECIFYPFKLVEESGVPGENHRLVASHWQTLSHSALSLMFHMSQSQ
jgi:hypothetical protein